MWDLDLATEEDLREAEEACGFCPFQVGCRQDAQTEIAAGNKLILVLRGGQAYDRDGKPLTRDGMYKVVRTRRGPRQALAVVAAGLTAPS